MIFDGLTVEDIGARLSEGGVAYVVRRGNTVVGRIVDRTPYVPVQPGPPAGSWVGEGFEKWVFGATAAPMQGTPPSDHLFEAQMYEEANKSFDTGPTFGSRDDALAWLVE